MNKAWILCFAVLLQATLLGQQERISLVIFWNVGQGQWITNVTPDECLHFDFGGEFFAFKKNRNFLKKLCLNKTNVLFLSHPDLDHYNYYDFLTRLLPKICWAETDHTTLPINKFKHPIALCTHNTMTTVDRIYNPENFKNKNDSSKIYRMNNILIPGDSSRKQEKIWSRYLTNTQSIRILSLGHHGSRGSTGTELLQRLPELKLAIAQSRFEKYKHPHRDTLNRMKKAGVPVLRTEDWGNIGIE